MQKTIISLVLLTSFGFYYNARAQSQVAMNEIRVEAPFEMPVIKIPDFEKCKKLFIVDYGAVPENQGKTTRAIALAIEEANKMGGGTVVIPKGEWLTGQVHFKSNVNLQLNKGAVLHFSENPADYLPAVHSSWEGLECYNYSPLIYAYQCKNIAITGQGEIKAKMDVWTKWFDRSSGHMNSLKRLYYLSVNNIPVNERQMINDTAHFRPQFIQINRCENVLLNGIKITNSPFWTVHFYLSKNIVVRNLNEYAHGHNSDGIDMEMCQKVLIENCVFDQGDDAIVVKSSRNPEGWRIKTPSKNIVVRNCTVKKGHQLLAIGSELSGGIENVFMNNCTATDGGKSGIFHVVFIKTNERMGGFVKNIHVNNIHAEKAQNGILGIDTDVLYQWRNLVPTTERRLTLIKDIYLENIKVRNVDFVAKLTGQKELPIENVFLKNVTADTIRGNQKYIQKNVINFKHDSFSPSVIYTPKNTNSK